MLNESKGNMFPFLSHTFNTIKGICPHSCSFCYMRRFKQNPVRLDAKELKTDLGEGNFIFTGSSCDVFADKISPQWIRATLDKCRDANHNKYLFLTKNPMRYSEFFGEYPQDVVLGVTLESDKDHPEAYESGNCNDGQPQIDSRVNGIRRAQQAGYDILVSVEPILRFDLSAFREIIEDIGPTYLAIGADSQGHNLPEPTGDEVRALIFELEKSGHTVIQKSNLGRLLK